MELLTESEYAEMESEFRSIPNDGSVSDDMIKYYCEEIAEKYLSLAFGRLSHSVSLKGRNIDDVENFKVICRNVRHYPQRYYLGDTSTLRKKVEEYERKTYN